MHTIPNPDDADWRNLRADLIKRLNNPLLPPPIEIGMRGYDDSSLTGERLYAVKLAFGSLDNLTTWAEAAYVDGYQFETLESTFTTDRTHQIWRSTLSGLDPVWYGWHQVEFYCVLPVAVTVPNDRCACIGGNACGKGRCT